ncbi:NAD(P)/FAD-dependent oxidoreductase, partial [Candidatus Omnitrophota bacterium]
MEKTDIAIIGAGVVGLAVAYALSNSGKDVFVIERNRSFGQETSSRNSEVIHSGIYYPPDSLKARTCIRGKSLLYEFCSKNNIPSKKLGKLVVAPTESSRGKIEEIYKNANTCGVKNLKILEKIDIKKLEPSVEAESAILSPDTGIIDSHALMQCLFQGAKARNVNFAFSVEAKGIEKEGSSYRITVKEPEGESFSFAAKTVINSAGLESDKVAELVGIDPDKHSYRIHYCKGDYFRIRSPKKFSIKHLVYPPPTETDLGIHLTPDLAGGLRLGPDAKYVKNIDYNIDE